MATIGKNIEIEVKDGKAIITVDLGKTYGKSSSGKTTIVASSEGNQTIPGTEIKIGLNVYKK